MMEIEVDIESAETALRGIRGVVRDLRPPMREAADEARAFQRRWFDSQGGGTWKALAPRTVKSRRERLGYYKRAPKGEGPKRRILHWTHALRLSTSDKTSADHVSRALSRHSWKFGTKDPRAHKHQKGIGEPGQNLPRRIVMPLATIGAIFSHRAVRYVREGIRRYAS